MASKNKEKESAKILIIDDDKDIVEVSKLLLESRGYSVIVAYDGKSGLEIIKEQHPDLILLDVMLPDMSGYQICDKLKKDNTLWHIPVIYFTARERLNEKVLGLSSGGDDYITKPFEPEELLVRIKMILTRTYNVLDANPLTKLPGHHSIMRNISQSLISKRKFAICFVDIDNFKSFNDEYGFEKGDEVITVTAQIIIQSMTLRYKREATDFIGHIGGDDFVFITTIEKVESISEEIIKHFDEYALTMYSKEARKRGYVVLKDRQGKLRKFPLMSISLVIVTNEIRNLTHMGEITSISSELKRYAKSFKGSIWVKDRRSDKNGEQKIEKRIIKPGIQVDEEFEDDEELKVYYRFDSLLSKKKINVFFLPIYNYPKKKIFGYDALIKGITKKEVIQPDVIFDLVRKTERHSEFIELCFDKIKVFTYGLNEIPHIFFHIALQLFMSINFNDYVEIPLSSLVITFSEKDIYSGDELFLTRLNFLREKGLQLAVSDIDGRSLDLEFLIRLRPDYIFLNKTITHSIAKNGKNQEILTVLLNMVTLFSAKVIVKEIENNEDITYLSRRGITLFQGISI
ncbi:response regulator [Chlamydiota bacterium]